MSSHVLDHLTEREQALLSVPPRQSVTAPFSASVFQGSPSASLPGRAPAYTPWAGLRLIALDPAWRLSPAREGPNRGGQAPQASRQVEAIDPRIVRINRIARELVSDYGETLLDFVPVVGAAKGFYDAYKNPSPAMVAAAIIGIAPAGKIGVKALKYAAKDKKLYEKLLKEARELYPKKAGKNENHHIVPRYLGGEKKGELARLDAAYHQRITNEFRSLYKYGQIKPNKKILNSIMSAVHKKFPLPPR